MSKTFDFDLNLWPWELFSYFSSDLWLWNASTAALTIDLCSNCCYGVFLAVARNLWWPENPSKRGQITEKSNRPRIETILYIVLRFSARSSFFPGRRSENVDGEVPRHRAPDRRWSPPEHWRFINHIIMPKGRRQYTVFVRNDFSGNNSAKSEPIGTKFYRGTYGHVTCTLPCKLLAPSAERRR